MKLRQLACGFMYEAAKKPAWFASHRTQAVVDLVEAIDPSEPVLIWAEFTAQIDDIAAEIGDLDGRRVSIIDGRTNATEALIMGFQECGRARDVGAQRGTNNAVIHPNVLVCHPKSVGHGVTLTAASYVIFASYSHSWDEHDQARRRNDRIGQTRSSTYYYLDSAPVDKAIRRVLRAKKSGDDALVEELRALQQEKVTS